VGIDGGDNYTNKPDVVWSDDHTRLWNVLCDLYAISHKTLGSTTPTLISPIDIAAWIFTNENAEHTDVFVDFCYKYGQSDNLKIENAFGNFASAAETYNAYIKYNDFSNHKMANAIAACKTPFNFVRVHTGDKFYIANLEMEVLFTHEDMLPNRISYYGDTSTVYRFTMHNTNATTYEKQGVATTAIWLGDLYEGGSNQMAAMFGEYLKSDMAQLSNHGGGYGATLALYNLIQPIAVFCPVNKTAFAERANAQGTGAYLAMNSISSVRYIFVQDDYNLTITLTSAGPNFNTFYDAYGKQAISFNTTTVIKITK